MINRKRACVFAVTCLLVGIGLLVGCKKVRTPEARRHVWQTSDRGSAKTICVGDTCLIILPGNPTTGYEWTVETYDDSVLDQLGEASFTVGERPATESPIVGQGGTFAFQFLGAAKGKTLLRLRYHRAWENQAPQDEFEVRISVQ